MTQRLLFTLLALYASVAAVLPWGATPGWVWACIAFLSLIGAFSQLPAPREYVRELDELKKRQADLEQRFSTLQSAVHLSNPQAAWKPLGR